MDQRTQVGAGTALLVVGSVIVLLYSFPASDLPVPVPVPLAVAAALAMAAGTLLVGTSEGTV